MGTGRGGIIYLRLVFTFHSPLNRLNLIRNPFSANVNNPCVFKKTGENHLLNPTTTCLNRIQPKITSERLFQLLTTVGVSSPDQSAHPSPHLRPFRLVVNVRQPPTPPSCLLTFFLSAELSII